MSSATKTQKQTTATKSAPKKSAAPKKAAAPKKEKAAKAPKAPKAPKEKKEKVGGKIAEIIELHKSGLSNKEIIEKGFNKSTVSIQVAKYKRESAK